MSKSHRGGFNWRFCQQAVAAVVGVLLAFPGSALGQSHGGPLEGDLDGEPIPPPSSTDTEPNDTYIDATEITIPENGMARIIFGTLGNGESDLDKDYFSILLPEATQFPMRLIVSVMGYGTLDSRVRVTDSSNQWLAEHDDVAYPDRVNPSLSTYVYEAGLYHILVVPSGSPGRTTGDYMLSVRIESVELAVSPLEPNDDSVTATQAGTNPFVVSDQFIGDGPNGGKDVDVYEIFIAAPKAITAHASVQDGNVTVDPVLSLQFDSATPNQNVVAFNDNADLGTSDAHIHAALYVPGFYYLSVSGAGRRSAIGEAEAVQGTIGGYGLTIETTSLADLGGPDEPNDSILEATATGLAFDGSVLLSGFLGDGRFADTRGDADFYHVEAWPGELVTIDVDAATLGSELDSVVVVYDYFGSVIASNDNDAGSTDSGLTFETRTPTPGSLDQEPADFYVMVVSTQQTRPADALVPYTVPAFVARTSEHVITAGTPTTGVYELNISIECASNCNNCCVTHDAPGCSVPGIESCVCAVDDTCCTVSWSDECVLIAGAAHECNSCAPPSASVVRNEGHLPDAAQSGTPSHRTFFALIDHSVESIVELDADTGAELNRIAPPVPVVRAGNGLAFDGSSLFYLGHGQFPRLYQMDPNNGAITDAMVLWSGSGYYGDITTLNDRLYIGDVLDGSVHELDPDTRRAIQTINVEGPGGAHVSGGLASLACPDRLYVADGLGGGSIVIVDPVTGVIESSVEAAIPCRCSGDFDGDGDVDAEDQSSFEDCETSNGAVMFQCQQTDLDCDGDWDVDDQAILSCQTNGPGSPPNPNCCLEGVYEPMRAAALAGSGSTRLYFAEWSQEAVELLVWDDGESSFVHSSTLPGESQIGAIGGQPFSECEPLAESSGGETGKPLPTSSFTPAVRSEESNR